MSGERVRKDTDMKCYTVKDNGVLPGIETQTGAVVVGARTRWRRPMRVAVPEGSVHQDRTDRSFRVAGFPKFRGYTCQGGPYGGVPTEDEVSEVDQVGGIITENLGEVFGLLLRVPNNRYPNPKEARPVMVMFRSCVRYLRDIKGILVIARRGKECLAVFDDGVTATINQTLKVRNRDGVLEKVVKDRPPEVDLLDLCLKAQRK